jgi:hypothetical protein
MLFGAETGVFRNLSGVVMQPFGTESRMNEMSALPWQLTFAVRR